MMSSKAIRVISLARSTIRPSTFARARVAVPAVFGALRQFSSFNGLRQFEDSEHKPERKKFVERREATPEEIASRVHVSNLDFDTEWTDIKDLFETMAPVKVVRIFKDRETQKSKGSGFIEFMNEEDAERILAQYEQGNKINMFGRELRLRKFDPNGTERKPRNIAEEKTRTVFVGNLPYKITKEDLQDAFSKSAPTENIYIPTGPDGRTKGFAFVRFESVEHANKVVEECSGVEIDGRILTVAMNQSK
ncbi:nucleolin [Acrasis kona]|uniref:Nucleolin n=1 Tax=Acrasis kona TaxID=1008807 RepID=A0AAW2ZS20_9EUKA